MINVVIETKDRRLVGGENYLRQTLENFKRAGGFASPHLSSFIVVSGGELPDFYETEARPVLNGNLHEFVHCVEPTTRQQNAMRAIKYGAMNPKGDWVLKLEDDLDFLDGFMDSLAKWLSDYGHAATPIFTLAHTYEHVSNSRYAVEGESVLGPGESFPHVRRFLSHGDNIAPVPVEGFWGALALVWRRSTAENLVKWLGDDPFLWDGREQHRDRGHDLLLQVWGNEVKARCFAAAVPSFVQHIGVKSGMGNPVIQFPFPGRAWRYAQRVAR